LPWRLGAREAVTASPCRGKLGFKSQEQRSNEVLNYFSSWKISPWSDQQDSCS
jgi:hypothetical protein